jgi:two-component system NtrC family response regulator
MANVLIVDDDEVVCQTICSMVRGMGDNAATYALTLHEGFFMATSGAFDAVFLDVCMPDGNGLEMLPRILQTHDAPEVIIITGKGEARGAELAIKGGAWDYLQKPVEIEELEIRLARALRYHEAKRSKRPTLALKRDAIIGNSLQIRQCLDLVAEAAGCDANVLIVGETGTGKELFASAIHKNSSRARENFVIVDCAALPENLVESMLFGYDKGAFTGADRAKQGFVQQADGGTLFLDEVGELPLSVQKSFLRVLQERRFRPLGGSKEIASKFRLVAATNRNLDQMVSDGLFRSDLLFRLRTITIEIPPLRAHAQDIDELTTWHIAELTRQHGTKGISPEFREALQAYDWPGNVRELFNAVERALAAALHDPMLFQRHLPTYIRVKLAQASLSDPAPNLEAQASRDTAPSEFPTFRAFRQTGIEDLERKYLADLLSRTGGNIKKACQTAHLSRTRLYYLLKKYRGSEE